MKRAILFLCLASLLIGVWKISEYFAVPATISQQLNNSLPNDSTPTTPVDWKVETIASNLQVPWSVVFPTANTIMFTERTGKIRLIQDGELAPNPLFVFPTVRSNQEQGLMGLAVHPNYSTTGWLYTCVSLPEGENFSVKISRLKADVITAPTKLDFDIDVLIGIAGARVHAGCALTFGPDGKLYIATGDATQKGLAKDPKSLVGKILRLNDDGSRPSDNPFPDSLVYTTGHRNPQGIAWHANGSLYSTEHGPSVFDGPAGGDEVNRIVAGDFYGWPDVSHEKTQAGSRAPLVLYTPAEAPASLMAYSGKMFSQFANNLFFGALKGEGLWRLEIDPNNPDKIPSQEKLFAGEYGRIRNVVEGPDGSIYFTTRNRDGRGDAAAEDDRILRLIPTN